MTSPPEPLVEQDQPCPQCGQPAEPEQAGDVVYLACPDLENCGAEFGHRKIQRGPVCAAGFSAGDLPARPGPRDPVLVATTISRRPE